MAAPGDSHAKKVEEGELWRDYWMIRDCDQYKSEYKECKRLGGRWHQYYMTGEFKDCTQWKEDFQNCQKFILSSGISGRNPHGDAIVKHELERKAAREKSVKENDVWEYRTSPPEDWSKPIKFNIRV